MPTTAYLHICIDTQALPPVVNQVRIMSDGNPTTMLAQELWVTVLHMDGSDYEAAANNITSYLQSLPTVYGWMNPFFGGELFSDMPLPEPPDPDPSENWYFPGPDPEPQPGLPALQRLDDLTFGEED